MGQGQGTLGSYINPFSQGVTQNALSDLEMSRQNAIRQTAQQAQQARAFGGSRQGVAEAQTNLGFTKQAGDLSARLNEQAFNQAMAAQQQDLARQQQAAIQNASQRTAASQFGASAANQAELVNAAARNALSQFNVGNLQQSGLSNMAAQNAASQFGAGAMNQSELVNAAARNALAQFNAGNLQQSGLSNMAAQNAASQFGAGAMNQAELSNAASRNQMAQFNANIAQQAALANQSTGLAGSQYRLSAAGQLGNLGAQQQALRLGGAQQVMGAGGARQQLEQQQLDAMRNLATQRLGIQQTALGMQPGNLGQTTSTPLYQNRAAGGLGGALAGSQLANLVSPGNAGYGAALGGLLGYFG